MKKILLMLCLGLVSNFASAQTEKTSEFNRSSIQPGTSSNTLVSPISSLTYTAGAEDQTAKAQLGMSFGKRHAFTFALTQRISGGKGPFTLLDLNGLTGNTKAALDWRFIMGDLESNNSSFFFAGGITMARNKFRYISDSLSTSILEEYKNDQQLKITLGYAINSGEEPMAIALSYISTSKFNSTDAVPLLLPLGSGAYYQDEASFGNPVLQNKSIFRLEIATRYIPGSSGTGNPTAGFGANPSFSYFVEDKRFALELPVYGISIGKNGKADGVTGGFSIGYLSPKSGEEKSGMITAKVFAGGALESLLGK